MRTAAMDAHFFNDLQSHPDEGLAADGEIYLFGFSIPS